MRSGYTRAVTLDPAAIRAYLAREWERARQSKQAYWRERLAYGGMAEALRVGTLLLRESSVTEREQDLETHQRVAQALAKTTPRHSRATRTRSRRVR
jgi:hypothetical protein